jgi:hypothetical protein
MLIELPFFNIIIVVRFIRINIKYNNSCKKVCQTISYKNTIKYFRSMVYAVTNQKMSYRDELPLVSKALILKLK